MLCFAVAFAMKPQSSFIFPVLAYVLYRRYLHRRARAEVVRGLGRIVGASARRLSRLWAVSGLPFGLSPIELKDFYSKASNGYKTTSVWAFNLWGVIGFQRGDVQRRAAGACSTWPASPPSTWVRSRSSPATAYVIWRAHRSINRGHDEARVLVASAAMTSLIAFTVLTRMHERYLFPVLACLAPLVLWRGSVGSTRPCRRCSSSTCGIRSRSTTFRGSRRTPYLEAHDLLLPARVPLGVRGHRDHRHVAEEDVVAVHGRRVRRARRTRLPVDRAGRRP